jgi:hypothetical protein
VKLFDDTLVLATDSYVISVHEGTVWWKPPTTIGVHKTNDTGRISSSGTILVCAIPYTIAEVHIRAEAEDVRLSVDGRTTKFCTRSEEVVDTQLLS